MAKLTEAVQRFIVQALACYDTPSEVAEAVKEEFGLELTRQQVATYDASKTTGRTMAKKWRVLFEDTRAAFRKEVSEIPIADQAYRLRQLDKIAQQAMKRKNVVLAAQMLEQAAKEVGGMYTNRREFTGKGGGPIETANLTEDQLNNRITQLMSHDSSSKS
jgi:hypothetical protein